MASHCPLNEIEVPKNGPEALSGLTPDCFLATVGLFSYLYIRVPHIEFLCSPQSFADSSDWRNLLSILEGLVPSQM